MRWHSPINNLWIVKVEIQAAKTWLPLIKWQVLLVFMYLHPIYLKQASKSLIWALMNCYQMPPNIWSNDLWLLFFAKVFIKYVEEIRWNIQTSFKISMQCLLSVQSGLYRNTPTPHHIPCQNTDSCLHPIFDSFICHFPFQNFDACAQRVLGIDINEHKTQDLSKMMQVTVKY